MRLFLKIIGGLFVILIVAVAIIALSLEATLPQSPIEFVANEAGQDASDETSILIFGATRNTGLMVAQLLNARGDRVTAFVRPTSDTAALEALGIDTVVGDAMDIDSVRAAMSAGNYRSVVSTIGCLSCEPPPDYQGNENVITAAVDAQIRRLVLITTIGAGNSYDATPTLSQRVLAKTLPLKTRAEEDLRASGLDYTIIRPGGMRSGQSTGNGVLTAETDVFGYIFREDLAPMIVAVLDDDRAIGQTLAALDANRNYPWSSN